MKFLYIGVCLSFLIGCSKKQQNTADTNISDYTQSSEKPLENRVETGYSLINGSDCLSCHKDNERLIGPSYAEIAAKYTNNDNELLASKIIDGGSGVWGEVPMQPHPQLTKEEAKKMVEYIMSLKK